MIATIDVNQFLEHSHLNGFMDDFVQTSSSTDLAEAVRNAEEDAQKMIDFFKINKLAIKTDKTALLVIKPNRTAIDPVQIKVDGEVISQKESFKMLGVIIDEKLSFEEHMTKLEKRQDKLKLSFVELLEDFLSN